MKMKKLIVIALVTALTIPLVGCGGDAEDLYELDTSVLEQSGVQLENIDEDTLKTLMQQAEAKDTETPDTEGKVESGAKEDSEPEEDESEVNEPEKEESEVNEPEKEEPEVNEPGEDELEENEPEEALSKKDEGKMYVALGNDLDKYQRIAVLEFLGITEDELEEMDVAYVTNEEEHAFLDNYIEPKLIGTNALSSVLVKPREKGYGIEVETKNIGYCSSDMYKNAFQTAGVKDADIIVAGPFEISGTAALIGAVKAYEMMSGATISDKIVDVAIDELITTGDIAEDIGSKKDAARLVSYIKAKVISEKPSTREELEALIRQALEDLGMTLSDEYIERIVDLILKIMKSGIDLDALSRQARTLLK